MDKETVTVARLSGFVLMTIPFKTALFAFCCIIPITEQQKIPITWYMCVAPLCLEVEPHID